jgi:hypothetical protein
VFRKTGQEPRRARQGAEPRIPGLACSDTGIAEVLAGRVFFLTYELLDASTSGQVWPVPDLLDGLSLALGLGLMER